MTEASASAASASPLARHHFLLRRLHSLSGIMPVGVFVMFHLFTNMQMAFGTFQHEVEWIHSLPALIFLEIFGLWLPIAFHAGLGVVYTVTGAPNTSSYKYMDNWRYTLQRVTGVLALVFIFLHVATLRWGWDIFGWYTPFFVMGVMPDPVAEAGAAPTTGTVVALAHVSTAAALQASWLVAALYIIGVTAAVYHWANGLWTAAISWGLTISVQAQRRWGYVCIAVFLGLMAFTVTAFYATLAYERNEQTAQEWGAYEYMVEQYRKGNKIDVHGAEPGQTISLVDHHAADGQPH